MKKALTTLTVFIALTAAALANGPKILTVDFGQTFLGYWKFQQEAEKLNSNRQAHQRELQSMAEALEAQAKQRQALIIEHQSPAISQERKTALEQEIQQLSVQLQQKQQEAIQFQQTNEQAMMRNEQALRASCQQDIFDVVAGIAEAESADFVMATENLIFSKPSYNITERVLEQLNANKPQSPATAAK